MAKGRHRKPTNNLNLKKIALGATVGLGAATVVPATFATSASAATVDQWDKLAQCESSGNWSASGFYSGGLQFDAQTWAAYGGTKYAPTAGQATKQQQIEIAEKLLADRGGEPWQVITDGNGDTSQGSCLNLLSKADAEANGGPSPFGSAAEPEQTPPPSPQAGVAPSAHKAIDWALAKQAAGNLYYLWGGEGPTGYDCSGYLQAAWRAAGVEIPRDTYGMDAGLPHVSQSDMRPGDLILWDFGSAASPDHVTMYLGDGRMVEMSGSRGNVIGNVEGRGGNIVGVVRPAADEAPVSPAPEPEPEVETPPVVDPAPEVPEGPGPQPEPESPAPADPAPEVPAPAAGTYKVVKGDWLIKIAKKLDVPGGWKAIYDANRSVIGSNPDLIYPDQVFDIPGAKAAAKAEPKSEAPAKAKPEASADPAAVHYKNCDAARAAGAAPVLRGEPGYARHLDRDNDGIGCEDSKSKPKPEPTVTASPVAEAPAQADYVKPVDASVSTAYHASGGMWSLGFHTGVDFAAPEGTPVKAAAAGTVVVAQSGGSYGTHVVIKHSDGVYTLYAHLSAKSVNVGDTVAAGKQIGNVGSTGNSTGPHLHFELRNSASAFGASVFSDPVAWLRSHGVTV